MTRLAATLTLWCAMLLALAGTDARAAEAVDLRLWEGRFLGLVLAWQAEPDGGASAQQMFASTAWRAATEDVPNFGVNDRAWWFRLEIAAGALKGERWLLEVAYPILDELEFHVFIDGVRVAEDRDGHEGGGPQRITPHRHYLYALPQTERAATVLLRLRSPTSVQLPAQVWRDATFIAQEEIRLLFAGGYAGIMLAMILFNLFLALSGASSGYFMYVGMVISVSLIQLVMLGFPQRFMPFFPLDWSTEAFPRIVLCAMCFAGEFCDRFLQLDRHRDPLRHPYRVLRWVGALAFLMAGWIPVSSLMTVAISLCLVGALLSVVLTFRHYDSGDRAVLYFCVAWTFFLSGTCLITLNKLALIPRNDITEYLLPVGSVLECILLSLALGERINQERRQKDSALAHAVLLDQQEAAAHIDALRHAEVARKAQEIALRMQQENNAVLERKVDERSRALEDINQRLEELTRLDPLTGVRNRRFLHQRLREEFQRASRAGHPLAVLMIDVDHFKQVNDRYGHLMGDDCLRGVADCLLRTVEGPGAVVTRFGGEEFCVLLPYASAVVAQRIAERLRRTIEDHVVMARGHTLRMTVSIGCFSQVPDVSQSPEEWLEKADVALYAAKREGRNRVCMHGQPDNGPAYGSDGGVSA